MTELWTAVMIADRLREAAETLWRLPAHHPGRRVSSSWPEIVRSFKELKGFSDPAPTRLAPGARAIDRMDEVLMTWLPRLDGAEVKILWSWMAKIPTEHTARKLGISRSTLNRRRSASLKKLAVLLNCQRVPIQFAAE